jgi:hypothetical protein
MQTVSQDLASTRQRLWQTEAALEAAQQALVGAALMLEKRGVDQDVVELCRKVATYKVPGARA